VKPKTRDCKNGFINDLSLIEENTKVDDLLDFSESIQLFNDRLETITKPSLLGLVGVYGSGKSTMLYQIQKEKEADVLWINFDAWKYPDRKDLWEGFVIDFADQLGKKKDIVKKIDGESVGNDALDVVGQISDKFSLIPGLSIIVDLMKSFINTSPAKRVFEIQHILTTLFTEQDQDVFIVVEDIDRSGDAGIYFLETLKQFLTTVPVEHRIVAIVPIGDDNYNQHQDSYHKVFNYVEHFSPKNLGLTKFVEAVFDESLFEGIHRKQNNSIGWTGEARKGQVISFLEEVLKTYEYITIRQLKLILRQTNQNFKLQQDKGYEPDFRVTLCIEVSRYVYRNSQHNDYFYDDFVLQKNVGRNNVFSSFLYSMYLDNRAILDEQANKAVKPIVSPLAFAFIHRPNPGDCIDYPSFPWSFRSTDGKDHLAITDFYLEF